MSPKPDVAVASDKISVRVLVVLAALVVMCIRIPDYFTKLPIIGEDGVIWLQAYIYSIRSLSFDFVGYLVTVPRVVALISQFFPVSWVAGMFFWSGIAIDLLVVWLLTSPRLKLPYKPLVALALVCTAPGSHILGVSMSHIQWTLAVGAFALLLMQAPRRNSMLALEMVLVVASSLTGPFGIFLAPIFLLQVLFMRHDPVEKRRLLLLTAVQWSATLCLAFSMWRNISHTLQPNLHPVFNWRSLQDWAYITTSIFRYFFMPFGEKIFVGGYDMVLANLMALAALVLFVRHVKRFGEFWRQEILIVLFACLVTLGGVIKVGAQERYLYIPTVLAYWLACCLLFQSKSIRAHKMGLTVLALLQLLTVSYYRDTYIWNVDTQWPRWSRFVHSGLPLTVFGFGPGWFINIPADPHGPLYGLNQWVGKDVNTVVSVTAPCPGTIESVKPLKEDYYVYQRNNANPYTGGVPRWVVTGHAAASASDIIVLTDRNDKVLGFAFTGFGDRTQAGSMWTGVFPATDGDIKAFALSDRNRKACPLVPGQ